MQGGYCKKGLAKHEGEAKTDTVTSVKGGCYWSVYSNTCCLTNIDDTVNGKNNKWSNVKAKLQACVKSVCNIFSEQLQSYC